MMILHRYVALRFLKPFLFGIGIFAILIFLVDVFDKMPRLVKSQAPLAVIIEYLWLEVPYWTVKTIPMATLLATLFAVAGFVRSGEWIAVQSAGFDGAVLIRPLLAMGALVTALSFAAQETVLPACHGRAQALWRDQIHPEWEWDIYQDTLLVARPGVFITTPLFKVKDGLLASPVVDYFKDDRVARQVAAHEGRWDPAAGRWVFRNGAQRVLGPGGRPAAEEAFETLVTDIDAGPRELVPRSQNPEEMSLLQTRRHLQELRLYGGSSREAWTAFHAKIAYPFSNLILCALGIPLALSLRQAGRALSFAGALAVCFVYLWFIEMGRAMGQAGRLHPALASWLPNTVFGLLAASFYRRPRPS